MSNWIQKLQTVWRSKEKIAEGFYNVYINHDTDIQKTIEERIAICESNQCGYYDAAGTGERVALKGQPACGLCGCNKKLKAGCLSCRCALADIGKIPLWEAVLTPEQEKELDNVQKNTNG
jgi:hypothetical protein